MCVELYGAVGEKGNISSISFIRRMNLIPPRATGLGLPCVKKILEILHGEIRAESRPGKGTVFSVMLPVEG